MLSRADLCSYVPASNESSRTVTTTERSIPFTNASVMAVVTSVYGVSPIRAAAAVIERPDASAEMKYFLAASLLSWNVPVGAAPTADQSISVPLACLTSSGIEIVAVPEAKVRLVIPVKLLEAVGNTMLAPSVSVSDVMTDELVDSSQPPLPTVTVPLAQLPVLANETFAPLLTLSSPTDVFAPDKVSVFTVPESSPITCKLVLCSASLLGVSSVTRFPENTVF